MNTFINYLIEANLGLIFFYAIYWLALKNENQFSLKRFYLLGAVLVSLLFPLLHFNSFASAQIIPSVSSLMPTYWLNEVAVQGNVQHGADQTVSTAFQWGWFQIVYWTITLFFCMLLLIRLFALSRLIRNTDAYRWKDCLVAESNEDKLTFSFFHFIFIGQANKLNSQEKEAILNHEAVHVKRLHSLDIVLISLLGAIFWFNPIMRIYKQILVQLHEYEADQRSVEDRDLDNYCQLLAKLTLQSSGYVLANHFNNSLTIKRIAMMKSIKHKIQTWKIIPIATAVGLFLVVVACQEQVIAGRKAVGKNSASTGMMTSDSVYTVVEEQPEFVGGYDSLTAFLQKEIKYPLNARSSGAQGRVFVTFVVTKDGLIRDVTIVKGVTEEIDKEAARVVSLSPKWIPGHRHRGGEAVNVRFVLPVNFKL